jgi:PEP-CTERM motif
MLCHRLAFLRVTRIFVESPSTLEYLLREAPSMRLITLVLVLLVSASPSYAGAILFTDRNDFDAAVGDHQLFTDFFYHRVDPSGCFCGTVVTGGVEFTGVLDEMLPGPGGLFFRTIGVSPRGAGPSFIEVTEQVTAFGFDLLSSGAAPVFPPGGPAFPTNVIFSFQTLQGVMLSTSFPGGSFLGVLLLDDIFTDMSLRSDLPPPAPFLYNSGFTIANVAVQSVPEPATALLLAVGAMVLLQRRRFTRPK